MCKATQLFLTYGCVSGILRVLAANGMDDRVSGGLVALSEER